MMRYILIVLLTVLVIGCTAKQEQAYREKYEPIVKNITISKENISPEQQEASFNPCTNLTGNDARADSPKRQQWEECWAYNNPGKTPNSW